MNGLPRWAVPVKARPHELGVHFRLSPHGSPCEPVLEPRGEPIGQVYDVPSPALVSAWVSALAKGAPGAEAVAAVIGAGDPHVTRTATRTVCGQVLGGSTARCHNGPEVLACLGG